MKVDESLLQEAMNLVTASAKITKEVEKDVISAGCSFCGLGCEGIVG
ncbi:hypothetical protein [Odoribacter lunatus]|nr:hypothetical protein [Odoribacter lunatus]